jgi:hypothetical protein
LTDAAVCAAGDDQQVRVRPDHHPVLRLCPARRLRLEPGPVIYAYQFTTTAEPPDPRPRLAGARSSP